jgi:hypothetical protein
MSNLEQFNALEAKIKETYLLADPGIIKLLCAAVIVHRLPSDPVWIFVVSPPSGGKTELLNCLTKVAGTYPMSTLTTNTFLSGMKREGKQTSLLNRIENGIFVFKDFTTILSMNADARNEIFGQFREVYDGKMHKDLGTGEQLRWKGKVSFISGVTTVIHQARALYAAMGERFLLYDLMQPDRMLGTKRAMHNAKSMQMPAIRAVLEDEFKRFLDEVIKIPATIPTLPDELEEGLQKLANLITLASGSVDREWRSPSKEITFVHEATLPFRFATQLINFASALMILNEGPLTELDLNILYKMALDSMDKRRRIIMQALVKYDQVDTKALAIELNLPTTTLKIWAEDLNALKLVDRIGGSNKDRWHLKEEHREVLSQFEHIEMLKTNLNEDGVGDEVNENEIMIEADQPLPKGLL